MWGQSQYNPASQFVGEIPQELIQWKREGMDRPTWGGSTSAGSSRYGGSHWGAGSGTGSGMGTGGNISAAPVAKAIGRVQPQKEVISVGVGDKVNHTSFGHGTVLAVEGTGDKTVAKVKFDVGEKRLLLRYAPLTKEA